MMKHLLLVLGFMLCTGMLRAQEDLLSNIEFGESLSLVGEPVAVLKAQLPNNSFLWLPEDKVYVCRSNRDYLVFRPWDDTIFKMSIVPAENRMEFWVDALGSIPDYSWVGRKAYQGMWFNYRRRRCLFFRFRTQAIEVSIGRVEDSWDVLPMDYLGYTREELKAIYGPDIAVHKQPEDTVGVHKFYNHSLFSTAFFGTSIGDPVCNSANISIKNEHAAFFDSILIQQFLHPMEHIWALFGSRSFGLLARVSQESFTSYRLEIMTPYAPRSTAAVDSRPRRINSAGWNWRRSGYDYSPALGVNLPEPLGNTLDDLLEYMDSNNITISLGAEWGMIVSLHSQPFSMDFLFPREAVRNTACRLGPYYGGYMTKMVEELIAKGHSGCTEERVAFRFRGRTGRMYLGIMHEGNVETKGSPYVLVK